MNNAPERIIGVSQSVFSVARHFGGCTAFNRHYVYNADKDELVRDDVWRAELKAKKEAQRAEKAKWDAIKEQMQGGLFGEE